MKIGELRESILIQELKKVVNDYGGTEEQYIDLYSCRAKKKTVSTKEYLSSQSETVTHTLKFICRKRPTYGDYISAYDIISNNHFILYKNDRYNIKHVHEFDDMKYIEFTVERVI
jgi:SPP1 family predicted phage head-tail adaptor